MNLLLQSQCGVDRPRLEAFRAAVAETSKNVVKGLFTALRPQTLWRGGDYLIVLKPRYLNETRKRGGDDSFNKILRWVLDYCDWDKDFTR